MRAALRPLPVFSATAAFLALVATEAEQEGKDEEEKLAFKCKTAPNREKMKKPRNYCIIEGRYMNLDEKERQNRGILDEKN